MTVAQSAPWGATMMTGWLGPKVCTLQRSCWDISGWARVCTRGISEGLVDNSVLHSRLITRAPVTLATATTEPLVRYLRAPHEDASIATLYHFAPW